MARMTRAEVELILLDRIRRPLNRALGDFKRFASEVTRLGRNITFFSAASFAGFGGLLRKFADFEDNMLRLKAIARGTDEDFKDLNATIRELGRSTSFTASQIAEASVMLARAGMTSNEINIMLESVLALSRATGTDLSKSAQIAVDTMRLFGLEASHASPIMDTLTAASNGSSQTLDQLFESLKRVGAASRLTGHDLADAATMMGLMANNGIKASSAGTKVLRIFKNLSKEKIQDVLKEVADIDVADAGGRFKTMTEIMGELHEKTKDLAEVDRLALLDKLAGRGFEAAAILMEGTSDEARRLGESFEDMAAKVRNAGGDMLKAAKLIESGAGGAIRRVTSAFESLGFTLIETTTGPGQTFGEWLVGVINGLERVVEKNGHLIVSFLKIAALGSVIGPSLMLIGTAMSTLATLITPVIALLSGLVGIIGMLIPALSALGTIIMSGAVPAIALIGATAVVVVDQVRMLLQALFDFGKLADTAISGASKAFSAFSDAASDAYGIVKDLFASGQIEAAFKVMAEFMKLAWYRATLEMKKAVWEFFLEAISGLIELGGAAVAFMNMFPLPNKIQDPVTQLEKLRAQVHNAYSGAISDLDALQSKGVAGYKAIAKTAKDADEARKKRDEEAVEKAIEFPKRDRPDRELLPREEMKKVADQINSAMKAVSANQARQLAASSGPDMAVKLLERIDEKLAEIRDKEIPEPAGPGDLRFTT